MVCASSSIVTHQLTDRPSISQTDWVMSHTHTHTDTHTHTNIIAAGLKKKHRFEPPLKMRIKTRNENEQNKTEFQQLHIASNRFPFIVSEWVSYLVSWLTLLSAVSCWLPVRVCVRVVCVCVCFVCSSFVVCRFIVHRLQSLKLFFFYLWLEKPERLQLPLCVYKTYAYMCVCINLSVN